VQRTLTIGVWSLLLAARLDVAVETSREAPDLGRLLDRLDGVARLYSDTALRFTCLETISAEPGGTQRFEYIYVYGADGKFRDYRTPARSRRGKEVSLASLHLPRWLGQAYSWAFIFRRNRRGRFRFETEGESDALGRPAIRLRFEPIPPIEKDVNDWYGTAWIDRETSQILRVEARTPDDFSKQERFQAELSAGQRSMSSPAYFYIESVTTDFAAEKNGMRFPSEVLIERSRFAVPGHRGRPFEAARVYRVRQTYVDYRFFSVRTAEEIRRILSESPVGPGHPVPLKPPPP